MGAQIRLLSDKRERPHLGRGCKKLVVCENEVRAHPQTVFADTPEAAPPWMKSKMFLLRPGLLTEEEQSIIIANVTVPETYIEIYIYI